MDDLTLTLVQHRERLQQVAEVLARYGFADWLSHARGLDRLTPLSGLLDRVADQELASLSEGERLRGALVELGTTWVKFGQMLSLRADLVGVETAKELEKLQTSVPADPPGVAHARVEAELGKPTNEAFASFDVEPFASGLGRPGPPCPTARRHRRCGEGAPRRGGRTGPCGPRLNDGDSAVPGVHRPGVSPVPAHQHHRRVRPDDAGRDRPVRGAAEPTTVRSELRGRARRGDSHAVPRPVDDSCPHDEPDRRRRFHHPGADQGDRLGRRRPGAAGHQHLPGNDLPGRIYHADPHPGNFLLPDGTHVAVLDFGDVGRISTDRRAQLETVVIAAATRDVDELTDIIIELTTPPPSVDVAALRSDIDAWLNRYMLAGVAHLDMAGIMNSGMELMHAHKLVLPADLALLIRVLLRLQGLGRGVGIDVKVAELLQPYVRQMTAQRFDPQRLRRIAARKARNLERFGAALPGELHAILEQASRGELGINVHVHDEDGAVDRLVGGLIVAASVLSAAELIARRSGPTVGGLSVPGTVAAGVGWMSWQRLASKPRPREGLVTRARRVAQLRRA